MTPVEAVKFVKFVSALWPQQRLEDATPDAWYIAGLKDVDAEDAAHVASRLAGHKVFISLAELLTEVKALRAERLARVPIPAPDPEISDDARQYMASLQSGIKRIAGGWSIGKALGRGGTEPSEAYAQARGDDRDPVRVAAILVPCPWPPCRSAPGAVCVDADGRRLTAPAHEARIKAAGLLDESGVTRLPEGAS